MKITVRIHIIIFFLFTTVVYSQYNPDIVQAEKLTDAANSNGANALLKKVDTMALSLPDKALYTYVKAKTLENTGAEHKALQKYMLAKRIFNQADSIEKALDINLDIAYLLSAQDNNSIDYLHYIKEYLEHYTKKNDIQKMSRGYSYMALYHLQEKHYKECLMYYKKGLDLIKDLNNPKLESPFYNNIAAVYNENLHKPDSGLYYLRKDAELIIINGNNPYDLFHNYVNQAASYRHLKQYQKAIELLKEAEKLPITENTEKHRERIYGVLHLNYRDINDFKNAYKYLSKQQELNEAINVTNQNIAIGDIDIKRKYQTLEKELENKVLKNNIKINRILVYTLIGLLVASFVIGLLIVKNARKREEISKQDKLIEQQRYDKALKEYELSTIDIMLQGQEKERQRIANDLHDNLGSMLATLKLNFENLKMRKNENTEGENKLYEKTDNLIEEAYQKVRRLAHAKNAGVFANEGLIPAIKKLALKISIPGTIQINVIPFGFTNRLDNTLEIAIFRIVQELATNIIKHSKATEATIHLTQHDYNINIIIEDNGVGMDPSKISLADGMGLHAIFKKAEQLDGTVTIDATPGRGTTIILDLPI